MVDLSRRGFLGAGALGALAGCASTPEAPLGSASSKQLVAASGVASFDHGVASGDATSSSAIVWTRISSNSTTETGFDVLLIADRDASNLQDLNAENVVSILAGFYEGVAYAELVSTGPARDFTVKADLGADGMAALKPAAQYFYRFAVQDAEGLKLSPVGSFKTLPKTGTAPFKAAVVSCSNYPFGFFNAYEAIAKRDDIDAVIHLGDYIYEYGRDGYGAEIGTQIGREHEPAEEIVSLSDYRQRYAQYRSDASLQAAHAACAWYLGWDDHESTNNSYRTGAENHQPETEGEWSDRKAVAVQAYLEWMPVRDPVPGRDLGGIYRSFDIGDLATLFMLESRLIGRSEELSYARAQAAESPQEAQAIVAETLAQAASPERTMLGAAQEQWLADGLKTSTENGKRWQILGNQVIMAKVVPPNLAEMLSEEQKEAIYAKAPYVKPYLEFTRYGLPLNLDAWDGFDAARDRLYESAKQADARLVTLTGDTHTAWANELFDKAGERRGVEFGCTSVTSPGLGSLLGMQEINALLPQANKEVAYYDAFGNGFTLVTFAEEGVKADYVKVSNVLSPDYTVEDSAAFEAAYAPEGVSELAPAKA